MTSLTGVSKWELPLTQWSVKRLILFSGIRKKKRRSNFNLAFRNWLKKTLVSNKATEAVTKRGSQSFRDYEPQKITNKDKSKGVGRSALKKLLGKKDEKPKRTDH